MEAAQSSSARITHHPFTNLGTYKRNPRYDCQTPNVGQMQRSRVTCTLSIQLGLLAVYALRGLQTYFRYVLSQSD